MCRCTEWAGVWCESEVSSRSRDGDPFWPRRVGAPSPLTPAAYPPRPVPAHFIELIKLHPGDSWKDRAQFIYKATKQHALNLARFVAIYKTALVAQRSLNGGKPKSLNTFIAGLIGGWAVFGERNAVNEQVGWTSRPAARTPACGGSRTWPECTRRQTPMQAQ